MYEERFGMKSNPFRANAEGPAVFVGPQQATFISRLQKALAGQQNIVTVSGPVGVGKTTIVTRALETNKKQQLVAWISRMRLAPDEVLDLLLAGFGVGKQPSSTIQRFAAFRRILTQKAAEDFKIIVVVEDALRLGNDALLELEALTAAESAASGGANIILMGPAEIDKRLNFPELARLKQRARLGQQVAALNEAEVRGYLKHCLRVASVADENLFDDAAATMLYRCSAGIPRVINNICDATMAAADEQNVTKISAELVRSTAADVLGLEPEIPEKTSAESSLTQLSSDDDKSPIESFNLAASKPTVDAANTKNSERPTANDENGESTLQSAAELMTDAEESSVIQDVEPHDEHNKAESSPQAAPKAAVSSKLPPIVADVLAQEGEDLPLEELDSVAAPNIEDVESDAADDEYTDGQLIGDTGMNIPPQFKPDPALSLPTSQLANDERFDAGAVGAEDATDELPTLSSSMRVAVPSHATSQGTPAAATSDKITAKSDREPVVDLQHDSEVDANHSAVNETKISVSESQSRLNHATTIGDDVATRDQQRSADSGEMQPRSEPDEATTGLAAQDIQTTASVHEPAILAAEKAPNSDAEKDTKTASEVSMESSSSTSAKKPEGPRASVSSIADQKPIPDLDALEAAISAARGSDPMPLQSIPEPVELSLAEEPTLDIDPGFDDALLAGCVTETTDSTAEPVESAVKITLDETLEDRRKEGLNLDEMAAELAAANSLEDISDVMAETLFGQEFEQIAADALANPPAAGTLPSETDALVAPAVAHKSSKEPPANDPISEPSPVLLEPEAAMGAATDKKNDVGQQTATDVKPQQIEIAAPQATSAASTVSESKPVSTPDNPDSIEEQIQTSITQTLKALDSARLAEIENRVDDDDDDEKSKGLFGRLKKTFKG